LRSKASASASASASAKNCFFWSHVKKRPLALALALTKASEKGPLALALPSLAVTQNKRLFGGVSIWLDVICRTGKVLCDREMRYDE
jgi:hypothetical protein